MLNKRSSVLTFFLHYNHANPLSCSKLLVFIYISIIGSNLRSADIRLNINPVFKCIQGFHEESFLKTGSHRKSQHNLARGRL